MKIYVMLTMILILINVVYANGDHEDFSEALEIIENKVPCEDLTDNEFELLGDYYMELMHPGEAHERMDEMMGGEGSESLRLMHINMGQRFYCGDTEFGMMGGGMMNYKTSNRGIMQYPILMMNSFGYFINTLLIVVLVIALLLAIIWLYKNIITKKEDPLEMLKKRLAKGEITKKQYESMKKEVA